MATATETLYSTEPMDLAQLFLQSQYDNGTPLPGLLFVKGEFWEFTGGRWKVTPRHTVADSLRWWLPTLEFWAGTDKDGEIKTKTLKTTKGMIDNLLAAVETRTRVRVNSLPFWYKEGDDPTNPHCTIGFRDVMFDAATGQTRKREPYWIDACTLPVDFDPEAKCPVWEKCLGDWSKGDPVWAELLERWMGYCLMPHNQYKKWMLMHGKVNAGKGIIAGVLQALLNGSMKNRSLPQLAERFGLAGLQSSRVLSITEAGELDRVAKDRAAQVVKAIIGRDLFSIDRKGLALVEDVEIPAKVMMQGNQIPNLSNIGRGLSSKMLLLPFTVSFGQDAKPDFHLREKLQEELPGIAFRLAMAAQRVEQEDDDAKKFEMPESSKSEVQRFHLRNNPADYFLTSCFLPHAAGRVKLEYLEGLWRRWHKQNGINPVVGKHKLIGYLEDNSSWDIRRSRMAGSGEPAMAGLSVRKEQQKWIA